MEECPDVPRSMIHVSRTLSKSLAITIIFSYFDIEDAIKFQLLNKHMYEVKTPIMTYQIVGRRIEKTVQIYEVYARSSRNALAVIVGDVPNPKTPETVQVCINTFLTANPMFAQKFISEEFSWPCFEDKTKLVAAFRFRSPDYRIRLSPDQSFYNKFHKKAVHSKDGFFRDGRK